MMKRLLFVGVLILVMASASLVYAQSYIECNITTTCSYTEVLYLKNDSGGYWNAHAQLVTNGSYPYVICCNTSVGTLSNSSCADVTVLKLSDTTNAHVQIGNYSKWANGLDRCMNITITSAGSTTLTNFPAYVNLTHDPDMQPDFRDVRFYGDPCNHGGSQLDHEIENYTTSDRAHVWVRIPSLPTSGTIISIYYKNDTTVSSGENPTGVWDSNYMGVWHMTEVNAMDSTSNQNNGTESGGVTYTNSGRVDGANEFDGNDDSITVSDDESLNFGNFTNFTIELWAKVSSVQSASYPVVLAKGGWGGTTQPGYNMYYNNLNGEIRLRTKYNNTGMEVTSKYNLSDNNLLDKWIHVGGRIDRGNQQELYVDGVLRDTDSLAAYPNRNITNDQDLTFGDYGSYEFNGTIDEVRVSDVVRSADWINQSYLMVANQSDYVSFGGEESGSGDMYPESACLSETSEEGSIECLYTNSDCGANYWCLASIASSNASVENLTNAHVGPCQEYLKNVCCRYYDSSKPGITIYSPENITYFTSPIDLDVAANEIIDTWWYSLNAGTNTTFTPNITITPAYGQNNITVYGNDSVGNIGSSTVWFTYYSMDMSITKIMYPSFVVSGESETVKVNITVKINQTKNNISIINTSDEVPYDFPVPEESSVRVYFIDYSPYSVIEITTNTTVNITILDQSGSLPTLVMVNISDITQTDASSNLTLNDSLMITYIMTTDQMLPDEQKTMYTHAWIENNESQVFDRIEVSYLYAALVVVRGYKSIWAPDLSNPQNLTGKIIMKAIGGTVSELYMSDYLPDGATIWDLNVTYYNSTDDNITQLVNNTDYIVLGPYDDVLPDGTNVDVYLYNFTIYSPVNWHGNLYDNDSLITMYNASVLGGGRWILPAIIAGWDPQYQKHIKTEMYGSANVPSFDVSLKTLTAKVQPGEVVKGLLRLINVGGPRAKVDVFVTYSAKTMQGDLIVEKSETFAVVEQKEKELVLPLPESVEEGMYTFEAFVTYTGREAMTTDIFEVIGTGAGVGVGVGETNMLYYILVAVMGIIIGGLIVIRRK